MVCLGWIAVEGLRHTYGLQMPAPVDPSDDGCHAPASVLQL